jgi:hypothetical protein
MTNRKSDYERDRSDRLTWLEGDVEVHHPPGGPPRITLVNIMFAGKAAGMNNSPDPNSNGCNNAASGHRQRHHQINARLITCLAASCALSRPTLAASAGIPRSPR